jgi:hypothetical protein
MQHPSHKISHLTYKEEIGDCRKLSTAKLRDFHSSAGIIRLSKSNKACGTYGEEKWVTAGKLKERDHLQNYM